MCIRDSGDGVRLAGARPARHRGRRVARLPHRAGGGALSLRHVHRREPPGRYALRLLEPQDPVRVVSVPALASVDAVDAPRRDRRWPPRIPLVIVSLLVVCALGAPVLAPRSPVEGSLGERLIPPMGMEGWKAGHPLGTDRHGRDVLRRFVFGARISLSVSVVGILLTGALGSLIGLV